MRLMAIRCPNCGKWQGKILYSDIKKGSFKCMNCRKSKKLVSNGKLNVTVEFCDSYDQITAIVSNNNLPDKYKA